MKRMLFSRRRMRNSQYEFLRNGLCLPSWTPWHFALQSDNANRPDYSFAEIMAVINPPGTNMPASVSTDSGHIYAPPQTEAMTYDDDGNLLSDGRFNYTWNGENRLIAVETRSDLPVSVPRVRVTYQYDHQSRRIGKEVSRRGAEAQGWEVAESRHFLYDGWNMIAETTGTNTTHYVWGLDLSGTLQGAGGVGGLLAVVKDSATYIPAYDANGNIAEYLSTDGRIVAHYEYSPFGGTVIQSGDLASTFAFRFSTKYWEDEAKLYYYGYRFYHTGTGRWLNRDPIGERGGANVYCFCCNESAALFDLNGHVDWRTESSVTLKIWGGEELQER